MGRERAGGRNTGVVKSNLCFLKAKMRILRYDCLGNRAYPESVTSVGFWRSDRLGDDGGVFHSVPFCDLRFVMSLCHFSNK